MNISTRSYLSFGLILFLFLICSVYQLVQTSKHTDAIKEVNNTTLKAALIAQDLEQILNTYQIQLLLPAVGAATQESIQPLLESYIAEFTDKAETYSVLKPEENKRIQEIMRMFSDFVEGSNEEAARLNELVIQMGDDNAAEINVSLGSVVQASEETSEKTVVFQVCVLAIAFLLSYYFAISLTRPITQLIGTSSLISAGDLSNPLSIKRKDEIGQLAEIMEQMRANLATFISQSSQTAYHVVYSSETVSIQTKKSSQTYLKILDSFNSIAAGAREQMKTTGEAATAMEELSNGIMQIADSTLRVEMLSSNTEKQAVSGNELLQEAEIQMLTLKGTILQFSNLVNKLAKQAQDINQIMDVIKSISAQTNLLSLNAGIEAARAGEQGKGFAVVANEIRKLAEQTSSSSDLIYRIVEGIQHETGLTVATVEVGRTEMEAAVDTVKVARATFDKILRATSNISKQSQEVNKSIEHISAGTEEISASVTDLAEIARMACTRIEEVVSEAGAEKQRSVEIMKSAMVMNEEALRLRQQISVYKI